MLCYANWVDNPNRIDIGSLIIRRKNEDGTMYEEPTIELQEPKKFIIIHNYGTGFIIEKFLNPFKIENLEVYYALGLVITAAHIIFSPIGKNYSKSFCIDCGLTKNDTKIMSLIPMKSFLNYSKKEIFSSNGFPYCLPDNVALCVLVSKSLDVEIETIPLSLLPKIVNVVL